MSKHLILAIATVGALVVGSVAHASAPQQCTAHDRLVQAINASYHTQFATHCTNAAASATVAHVRPSSAHHC
ncbi:hypothetical protein ACOSOMT5_P2622 [Acidiphilium sp. MT5]